MTSVLAFLFVLGVLVFVHELGHYLMARRIGVRVLTFSLGFGPKLINYRRGETDYCVSAIPLGGYVKMAGENPDDQRSGADDEFLSKPKWQRFQVMIMGPAMNIILAIIVMTFVLYQGAEVPAYEQHAPVIATVSPDSPAERAGIEVGDLILEVSERPVETWEDFFISVMPRAGQEIPVTFARDSERLTVNVTPDAKSQFEMGDIGVLPEMNSQVRRVSPGAPADLSGIVPGDVIVGVNGGTITQERPLILTINQSADIEITLMIRREGREIEISVTPEKRGDIGLIGVELSPYELRTIQPGFLQSFVMSLERNRDWSGLIFQTLGGLLTRETSPKQLMGPVAIAQLSGGAAEVGWIALFTLMAMISLNLGILNLLPIPVLDGGHIFIMALEGITRRDFSVRLKEKVMLVGFVLLMTLMLTVIYNDLMRIEWIERLLPWR
mgnify:CR=1 FL=1